MIFLELSLEEVYDRGFGGLRPPLNQRTDTRSNLERLANELTEK